jgi:hypothetical protein
MSTVIRVYGLSAPAIFDGEFVETYVPEAFDGRGDLKTTIHRHKAMKFDDKIAALKFAHQVPLNRPLRADGKPNRPLTAFTLQFEDD